MSVISVSCPPFIRLCCTVLFCLNELAMYFFLSILLPVPTLRLWQKNDSQGQVVNQIRVKNEGAFLCGDWLQINYCVNLVEKGAQIYYLGKRVEPLWWPNAKYVTTMCTVLPSFSCTEIFITCQVTAFFPGSTYFISLAPKLIYIKPVFTQKPRAKEIGCFQHSREEESWSIEVFHMEAENSGCRVRAY